MIEWTRYEGDAEYPHEIGRCGRLTFKATHYNLFISAAHSGFDHLQTCAGIAAGKQAAEEYVRSIVQDFNRTEGE